MVEPDERVLLARERTDLAIERNRLANERTFLAWTRTGLAAVGGGIAVIRFLTFQTGAHRITAHFIGCVLVLLGIGLFSLSFFDYKSSYNKLKLQDGAGSLWSMGTVSVLLIVISIILLFIVFIT